MLDSKNEYEFESIIETHEENTMKSIPIDEDKMQHVMPMIDGSGKRYWPDGRVDSIKDEQIGAKPYNNRVKGFFDNWKIKEVTWQDAYIAMANGQQVQVWIADGDRWETINHHDNWSIADLAQERIRLEPPTVKLEARSYTKEELLKIVEDMND